MAMSGVELASAYISLIPSLQGAGRTMERELVSETRSVGGAAGRQAGENFSGGFSQTAKNGIGTIGTMLRNTLAVAGTVAGAAGAVGIKTAAGLETSEIAFTTMLGSGEKAKAFLEDLNKFAAKTPFDFPGLSKAASSLVSAGIDANKVIPIMTNLGNATSGMGTGAEGVQRATVAIQQMNAAQKISGEDLNQLRDAGIPVYDLLAAATGRTKVELADMAAKGKLGKEELDALMSAMESGKGFERFTGLMDKQSESLAGLWSTFKDTFQMGMAEAIQPLIPVLKDGLGGATVFLSDVALPKLFTGLGTMVTVAQDAYDILTGADYTGKAANFGIYEDSKLIDFLFDLREGGQGVYDIFVKRDFTGPIFGMEEDHDFVNFLFTARDAATGLWAAAQQLDFSSLDGFLASVNVAGTTAGPLLKDIGVSLGALWPAFQAFAEQAPDFATGGLTILAAGLGFLADHVDWIIANMPLIVGLFVAWKVAMIAVNAAQAIAIPLQIALNVSRIQAAAAERGLAAAHREAMASTAANTVSSAAHGVVVQNTTRATLGQRVAMLASGAAAGVAAAGQWLLNAALTANPIGIVIVAIGALVAGLVWFFTQTEIGQQIIQNAWAGIKMAIGVVADWFTQTVWPAIKSVLDFMGAAFNWLWTNIIGPVFRFAGGAINAWWMLVSKIFEIAVAFVRIVVGGAFTWLWDKIRNVFDWASNKISTAWTGWKIIFGFVVGYLKDTFGPTFNWLWKNVIEPVWNGISSVVSDTWNKKIKPVFDTLMDVIKNKVPDAFETGKKSIGDIWDGVKSIAKMPINFVINDVLNDGLIAAVNFVAEKVGVDPLPDIDLPGFMDGGHTGPGRRDEVKGVVHANELVLPEPVTSTLSMAQMSALLRGDLHGAAANGEGNMGGYFMGNANAIRPHGAYFLDVPPSLAAWNFPGAASMWDGAAGISVKIGRGSLQGRATSLERGGGILGYTTGNNIDMSPSAANTLTAAQRMTVAAHEMGHAMGLPHNSGNSIMQPFLGNMAATPTPLDISNLQTLFPGGSGKAGSGNLQKGFLEGLLTPLTDLIDGLADTINNKFPGAEAFTDLAIGAGKTVLNSTIDWVQGKLDIIGDVVGNIWEGTKSFFGIGATLSTSDVPLYDTGGWLAAHSGIQAVRNETGKKEAVLTNEQWELAEAALLGGGSAPAVQANFYGADMDQAGRMADQLWFEVNRRSRGGVHAGRR